MRFRDICLWNEHVFIVNFITGAISQMNSGYIPMGTGHAVRLTASAPIPIRQPKEPGYMEMGPSSQPLPQIKEGGSKVHWSPLQIMNSHTFIMFIDIPFML